MSSIVGPYTLGAPNWNAQASAWGSSGNLPGDQPVGSQNEITIPFWDAQLDSAGRLDPSNQNLSPWDIVFIGGRQLPGYCTVEANKGRRIDVKQSKGAHYATLTFNGYDPSRVTVACRIWTQAQYDTLDSLMSMLEAPPTLYKNGTFSALQISHPSLKLQGIAQVLINGIDSLRPSSVKGVWEMKIHAIEYRVVKTKATATADGTDLSTVPHLLGPRHSGSTPGETPSYLAPGT